MTDQDVKRYIEAALKSFSSGSFSKNALALFGALGYNTSRQNPFTHKTTTEFEDNFGHAFAEKNFNKEKARFDEWKTVDLLFQLSREELSGQQGLFDSNKINWVGEDEKTVIETYLFFAIELTHPEYSRTLLAQITREVNKIFPMPVMIIFRHGHTLTLSIIDRRLHKRDAQKDVLKKVTLIKDIFIAGPHRAHLEILFDLSLDELRRVHKFINFVELHQAWQKTLDTKELNKRFYRELANWYFWAVKNVSFPNDVDNDKDDTVFNSESVIRMLTRLIFIWFIKEKHLIPENIFDEKELKGMVKNFNTAGATVYYRAVLQNLFFATLNKRIEERAFATDGTFEQNRKNYGIKNLYRYSSDFNISKEAVIKMFAGVPFLNGGLFDCLDFEDEIGKVLYLDGFSRNPKKQAQVPDKLFFAREHNIDLSDIYDDKKKKNEKVKGLFEIFNHYKFTITENTPIEEEIALDPELLGRVFENLLASYNPETQTTARKQTGSFYTPREIVNYMVDESLKAHLKQSLETEAQMKPHDADTGLEILFTYTEKEHAFTGKETKTLIDAIDNCKILDPACGSGAFPMGILHKLVHILHKLDPQNEKWKERQITKARQIDDPAIREQAIADIEAAFTNNELDYGRKLYLIENCIYGIDIQPIATQISKLRFFISLIVDQKADKKRDNFGIRPLPNLETKFVAANTLIGLAKPQTGGQTKLKNMEIWALEDELKALRHQYFNARTRTEKRNCQKKDQDLRQKISKLLENDGWEKASAKQIAEFDPYDQNSSSPFFDPEWMFGITDGFDVVIGNPPYVRADNPAIAEQRAIILNSKQYETLWEKWDLMIPFCERGLRILKQSGVLTFILSNSITTSKYAEKLQDWIIKNHFVRSIDYFDNIEVFEAGVIPIVLSLQNNCKGSFTRKIYRSNNFDNFKVVIIKDDSENIKAKIFRKEFSDIFKPEIRSERLGNICYLSYGLRPNSDERYWKGEFTAKDVISNIKTTAFCKTYLEGKQIEKYKINKIKYIEWNTERVPHKLVRPTFPDLYTKDKLFLGVLTGAVYDNNEIVCNHSIVVAKRFCDLKNVVERSISVSISKNNFDARGSKTSAQVKKRRVELENISQSYQLKYILALINSSYAMAYLNNYRRHRLENYFYPDDFRNFSIPAITVEMQNKFVVSVDYILYLKANEKDSNFFELLIDALVYELYFPNEIKAADAEVLKHLNNLPELKDGWSDKKKLETIEKVYQELSDEKHPVSIAMVRQKNIPGIRIIEGRS